MHVTTGLLLLALLIARDAAGVTIGERPTAARPSAVSTLRLVTFNIHAWRDSDHKDNLERICAQLLSLDADIVCLNEVLHKFTAPPPDDPYWQEVRQRRGHGYPPPASSVPVDEADSYLMRLSKALSLPNVAYGPACSDGFFGGFPFGNAVLSKYALADVHHLLLRLQPGDLTLGGQERTKEDLEPRSVTLVRVKLPPSQALPCGASVGVCCTHLDHKSEELRERQIREAAAEAHRAFGGLDGCPTVLCGDLNSFGRQDMSEEAWATACEYFRSRGWPQPPERSLVCNALDDIGFADSYREWQARPSRFSPEEEALTPADESPPPLTCWSHRPLYRLDYVCLRQHPRAAVANVALDPPAPARLEVRSHQTIASDVSDHHAVCVDFDVVQ
uniref:Endonuclease/exonuclease/phosphatase domain-containing protein n=1 Tax=Coccolithus braarudii TaxID=221442 RepID=A0A7S0LNR4_9EUKA|mmetsp:Transcript_45703/g.97413  ORF Transcript_45703/g.97413 Transcript_45703/m.97413 type:complete len:389 (+) Transcript_45703:22-1188(+)